MPSSSLQTTTYLTLARKTQERLQTRDYRLKTADRKAEHEARQMSKSLTQFAGYSGLLKAVRAEIDKGQTIIERQQVIHANFM